MTAAFDELRNQEVTNVAKLVIQDLSDEMAQCCLQGTNLARHIVAWARSIAWVEEPCELQLHQSVGISWFELLCNFYICTGYLPPVRVAGHAAKSEYREYFSLEAQALMPSRRAASAMCYSFQNAVISVETLTGSRLTPRYAKSGSSSLKLAGYFGESVGICFRPVLQMVNETLNFVQCYIAALDGAQQLSAPIGECQCDHPIRLEPIPELSSGDRYRQWNKRKKYGLL